MWKPTPPASPAPSPRAARTPRAPRPFGSVTNLAQMSILTAAVWAGCCADVAYAGPENETIVRGDVTFIRNGDHMIIQASDGSIINYLSFDILPWESVRFIQPNNMARVLNRITGPEPTIIQGQLLANGQVYLVNPAGVYFGQGAVVDVGGLYAAAGNMTNSHFIQGLDKFTDLSGEVINEGLISGNAIHLMGNRVANHGTLMVPGGGGIITMLAGDSVYLKRHGERITVKLDGKSLHNPNAIHSGTNPSLTASPGVENTGEIINRGGVVNLGAGDLYALAIRNTGTIDAGSGEINLVARSGAIHNTGLISASSDYGQAGSVLVQGPSIVNEGEIRADSTHGQAGSVHVLSKDHTYLVEGSVLSAAGGAGQALGGEVLVNSNGYTVFADGSTIDVSGGAQGGRGGFAEVSGDSLTYSGQVKLDAHSGSKPGTLLIDPYNIIITENTSNYAFDGTISFIEGPADTFLAASQFEGITGEVLLQANGNIFVGQLGDDWFVPFNFNNDVTFQAKGFISVRVPLVGANSLTFEADWNHDGYGWVSINVPLVVGDFIDFSGTHIFLGGHSLTTGGTQTYRGYTELSTNYVLTGSQIFFNDTVDTKTSFAVHGGTEPPGFSNRSLTINGDVVFNDPVGVIRPLRSLQVNGESMFNPANGVAGNPPLVLGNTVITDGRQRYNGPVLLAADTTFTSLGLESNNNLDFLGTVDGAHALYANTSGTTRFMGKVGSGEKLTLVATDGPGNTIIGADMKANALSFGDKVALADSVTLKGTDSIAFAKSIDGDGHNLKLNSPLTEFHGNATGFHRLTTDADGLTIIDAARIEGRYLNFRDTVEVTRDSRISGDKLVNFGKTFDGRYDVHILSDELVHFGGDVGGATSLDSLRIDVGGRNRINDNLIVTDGNLINVEGDILLNPDGKNKPARVATIAGSDDLVIRSRTGNIVMGENEKLTALGDLSLFARQGSMRLGDLNADGDMLVDSPDINLRRRDADILLNANGDFILDRGVDVVANGSIDFTSKPNFIGSGPDPAFASRQSKGSALSNTLNDFTFFRVSDLNSSQFVFNPILDLTATGGGGTNLAEALPLGDGRVNDRVKRDPFALRDTSRVAVNMRPFRAEELLAATEGRQLYLDTPKGGLQPDAEGPADAVLTHRLRRDAVLNVIEQYDRIFIVKRTDPETGEVIEQQRTEEVREALAAAWSAYAADAAGTPDAAEFRTYLAQSTDHADAAVYVEELAGLAESLRIMGATPREYRDSLDAVLGPVTPAEMEQQQLEIAINAS